MSADGARKADATAGSHRRYTYSDYLELHGWEFDKFRNMPPISDREIAELDWDELAAEFFGLGGGPQGTPPIP